MPSQRDGQGSSQHDAGLDELPASAAFEAGAGFEQVAPARHRLDQCCRWSASAARTSLTHWLKESSVTTTPGQDRRQQLGLAQYAARICSK
jgi:hypothetical protein